MPGRRSLALLILAAVFALHGLQCTSGLLAPDVAHHAPAIALSVPAVDVATDHSAERPVPVAGSTDDDTRATGHLEALCLAVLAAGLVVLLVVAGGRSRGLPRPPPSRPVLRRPGWTCPPPAPDLHALCLLRT